MIIKANNPIFINRTSMNIVDGTKPPPIVRINSLLVPVTTSVAAAATLRRFNVGTARFTKSRNSSLPAVSAKTAIAIQAQAPIQTAPLST